MTLKTLDDLINEAKAEGKQPWELKLTLRWVSPECEFYFVPYFKTRYNDWYGLCNKGRRYRYKGKDEKWCHFQETKPKKKYAIYAKCVGMQPSMLVFNGEINSEYRPPFFGSYALGLLEESEVEKEHIKIPNTELELEDE